MARKAHADRLEPSPMPSAASTWFVHVDDLAPVIEVVRAPAVALALRELLKRHIGPEPEEIQSGPTGSTKLPPAVGQQEPAGSSAVIHKTKRRANRLAAVFRMAGEQAIDPNDWMSIWAALVKIAQRDDRPAPLLGYHEGDGVKYQTDNDAKPVAWLSLDAFRQRIRRKG